MDLTLVPQPDHWEPVSIGKLTGRINLTFPPCLETAVPVGALHISRGEMPRKSGLSVSSWGIFVSTPSHNVLHYAVLFLYFVHGFTTLNCAQGQSCSSRMNQALCFLLWQEKGLKAVSFSGRHSIEPLVSSDKSEVSDGVRDESGIKASQQEEAR